MEDGKKEEKRAKWEQPAIEDWEQDTEPVDESQTEEPVREETAPARPAAGAPQGMRPPGYCHPMSGMCHPRKGGCYPQGHGGYIWKHQCAPRFLCYPRAYYQQSGWNPPFGNGYGCYPRR